MQVSRRENCESATERKTIVYGYDTETRRETLMTTFVEDESATLLFCFCCVLV